MEQQVGSAPQPLSTTISELIVPSSLSTPQPKQSIACQTVQQNIYQQAGSAPQPLSTVIDAPRISTFISNDSSHISILETLLESNIVGIDSEIRTEYENGTAFRFPILSLCLDGLDRLLEKHEKAKQMLQEKIAVETTGVVHSLPIARTGFLSAGAGGEIFEMLKRKWEADNTEELARLKSKLEAEYAEKKKELISENFHKLAKQEQKQETEAAEELAKLEQRQQAENAEHFEKFKEEHRKQTDEDISKLKQKLKNDAAEELAKYKETAYREAAKAATAAMTAEFERSDRIREIDAAKELAKMKKDLETEAVQELSNLKSWLQIKSTQELGRIRAEIVAKSNKVLEEVLAEHNRDFQARMEQNTKNLTIFSKKWYIESTGVGNVPLHLTPSAAVKLLANTPYVLSRYRDLCSDALVKYKKDLKAQYQNHLNDIELECRQWLKANAGSGLKVDVLDGLEMTINKGKAVDFHLNFNLKSKRGIQNLHGRITQEDLEQELKEISADYEDQLRKGALEGGLGLPQVKTQDQTLDLSIQKTAASADVEMMTVVDDLVNSMVAEKSFLGKPLNEAKARANSQVSSSGMAQWKTKEPTRQQPLRQAAPAFSRDAHQVPNKAANGSLMRAEMKSHVETIWQEHPTASQAYRSKEELFDRMFYGKTVTEIYEILARGEKRKRVSDGEGDDNGLLHKKAGQCGAMKE